jgi:hypothetical protein
MTKYRSQYYVRIRSFSFRFVSRQFLRLRDDFLDCAACQPSVIDYILVVFVLNLRRIVPLAILYVYILLSLHLRVGYKVLDTGKSMVPPSYENTISEQVLAHGR